MLLDSPNKLSIEDLQVNRVLTPNEDFTLPIHIGAQEIKEDYLIVLVDISLNQVFAINLDTVARFPIRLKFDSLCQAIEEREIELADMQWPSDVLKPLSDLPEKKQQKAEERFKVIQLLVDNMEAVLRNSYGECWFQTAIKESGRSKQYIYDCFFGYLRMAQRKSGLSLPIGKNAVHIPKESREIRLKQGRPNRKMAEGKVLDERDLKVFLYGKNRYAKPNGPSILATFKWLTRKHYYKSRIKHSLMISKRLGREFKISLLPADERPSYNQFYYWLVKEYGGNLPKRDKSRQNSIENKKDKAGRTGDAFAHVIAPGQVFQLDETPFDEELVSVFDPTRSTKISKATLYFVIDSFTKLIVGLFITTENPSYKTVRQALFNSARDKAAWFDELGLDLNPDLWSQRGVPTTLLVDRAEFHNKISEGAVAELATVVKFTRAGRGDDKPDIEQLFHIFSQYFKGISSAHQTKSQQDIARQLARKNAQLTIQELHLIAIVYVIYHNNRRRLKHHAEELVTIQDLVPAIPAQIWSWGIRYRPGYLLHYPDDELYLKLLPQGKVTVHREGLYLREMGLWYNCEWTLETGLQEHSLKNQRRPMVFCRYNEELVDIILICTEKEGLKVATLDHKYQRFLGLSFYEVKERRQQENNKVYDQVQLEHQLGVYEFTELLLSQAKTEKIPGPIPRISKIKDNRNLEAFVNRFADTNRFLQAYKHECLRPDLVNEFTDETDTLNKMHSAFDEDDN